eukprot:9423619-Karenia_brevis.AAC.1
MRTESKFVEQGLKEVETFNKNQKRMREEEGKDADQIKEMLGLPAVHCFNGFLKVLMEKKPDLVEELNKKIAVWQTKGGWKHVSKTILHFKMSR